MRAPHAYRALESIHLYLALVQPDLRTVWPKPRPPGTILTFNGQHSIGEDRAILVLGLALENTAIFLGHVAYDDLVSDDGTSRADSRVCCTQNKHNKNKLNSLSRCRLPPFLV